MIKQYELQSNNYFFSIQILKELKTKDVIDIIEILNNYENLPIIFNNTKFSEEMIYLMVEILLKLANINNPIALKILNQIVVSTFFFQTYIRNILKDPKYDSKYLTFLNNLLDLSDKLLIKLSNFSELINYDNLSAYSFIIEEELKNEKFKIDRDLSKKVIQKINKFQEKKMQILKKNMQEKLKIIKYAKEDINAKIKIDYLKKEVLLSDIDFKENSKIIIARHRRIGSYYSYPRYFNTMFYLEYEDCYRSVRSAINTLQANHKSINEMDKNEIYGLTNKYNDLYFYINGNITKIDINKNGIILTLDFCSPNYTKIMFTKRMILGSLVIITNNNYDKYLLTSVFYNPYISHKINPNNKGKIYTVPKLPYYRVELSLVNISTESFSFLINNRENLQIFESKAYFESYIHILKRLKEIKTELLPFKKELIDANYSDIKISEEKDYTYKYLKTYTLRPYQSEYPLEFKKKLDESQLNAVDLCLNNKIALIQGPPGTGKTHVGAIITDIISQNLPENSQILVVCYTNHALDQFIENVLKSNDDLIRIGGRCKNEIVMQKQFVNVLKYNERGYRRIVGILDQKGNEMNDLLSLIDRKEIIDENIIRNEFNSLYNKIIFDFYIIIKEVISKQLYDELMKKIPLFFNFNNMIYSFWMDIDNKKKNLIKIISEILKILNIKEKKEYDELFIKLMNEFEDFYWDNDFLLNQLNDNIDLNENEDNNNINISYNNYKKNFIQEKEEENQNNNKKELLNNEEEEEDDEEEINLNRERLGYRDNESESEGDIEIKEIYDNSEIKNGLFFEKYDEIYGVKPLNEKKFKYLLDYNINFYELGPKITKLIIIYIKQKLLKNKLKNKYDFDNFNCSFLEKNHISIMSDAKQIKNYKIVAMTTTGCSKYSAILELCNFNTIIIEEAAEVLESHVLSTLTPKVNHLILIGDHQQLRPKPYNYEIATKYNFDISMFERLINNDIPYAHLKYQRRMKPKFANFVRIIYGEKDYVDYEDVKNNEKVEIKGLTTDMLIITHNKYEIDHEGLKSKQNDYEAKYISRLCEYLLKQGYNSDQITILTFYIGQVILIKKYLKQKQIIDVRVSSIDNYQGEECDIILLSLVRSNERYEIGFLQSFNRVCVAFSRAKLGFFIIGNLDCIVKGEELLNKKYGENGKKNNTKKFGIWAKIQKEATKIKIIDNKIILRCQNHKKETIIKTLNDFDNCPEGGCLKICRKRMKCGHACQKACHNFDCNDIKCLETITKINENCEIKKHYCTKICSESWPKCEEKVNKKLLCGHNKKNVKCCDKIEELKCYKEIEKTLLCGHKQKVKCCDKIYEIACNKKCDEILPCGHKCKGTCNDCLKGTLHKKCEEICGRNLCCGHICKQKCSSECLCEENCNNVCQHGYCDEKCCDICIPCTYPCEIKCIHSKCTKECGELCDRKPCNKRCSKLMKCKHQCYGLCGERCPEKCRKCKPNESCFLKDVLLTQDKPDKDALFYKLECGHIFVISSLDAYINSRENYLQMYTCPTCKKPLVSEKRYQNLIKKKFSEIQEIKKLMLEKTIGKEDNTYLKKSEKIINRILNQYDKREIYLFDILNNKKINYNKNLDFKTIMPIIFNLCKNEFKLKNDIDSKKNITYNLLTLAEKFMGIEYFVYITHEMGREEEEKTFLNNFNVIKNYFKDFKIPFNNFFFKALKKKIDNMLYYAIIVLNINDLLSKANNYFDFFTEFKDTKEVSPNEIKESNFSLDLNSKDLYNREIEQKALELIRTLGTSWYKCPKGHLYAVGECGRPMEESSCPECGKKIGGENHIPAKENEKVEFDLNEIKNNKNFINSEILDQDEEAAENMDENYKNNNNNSSEDE